MLNSKMDRNRTVITNIQEHKFSYLWTINNFTLGIQTILHYREVIESPLFNNGKKTHTKWRLNLSKDSNILNLSLKLVSSNTNEIFAKLKFSIINDEGIEKFKLEGQNSFLFKVGSEVSAYSFNLNEISYKLNGLLSDDKLNIFCQISEIIVIDENKESTIKAPECRLIENFEMLFETKKFSDAILSVSDGKEFQVHKAILAARSPVFSAMFDHEMEEQKLNRVNITDIDYETLHELLKFIYTGKANNLQTMAGKLLAASDKYDLERLKVLCEEELCANLSTENAAEVLILADLHGADQLKTQAINFIHKFPDVMVTVEWKKVKESHSHLVTDVCEHLLTLKNSVS